MRNSSQLQPCRSLFSFYSVRISSRGKLERLLNQSTSSLFKTLRIDTSPFLPTNHLISGHRLGQLLPQQNLFPKRTSTTSNGQPSLIIAGCNSNTMGCGLYAQSTHRARMNVPVIKLPHMWNEEGRFVPRLQPRECNDCSWSVVPRELFGETRVVPMDDFQQSINTSSECPGCHILKIVLREIALQENKAFTDIDTITSSGRTTTSNLLMVQCACRLSLHRSISQRQNREIADSPTRVNVLGFALSMVFLLGTGPDFALFRFPSCLSPSTKRQSIPTYTSDQRRFRQGCSARKQLNYPAGSRYVALNYCCGHHKPECLTSPATLNKRMKRIQWSILPKNFQDAVNFTRSLGIRYLWIDSTCIIQGDKNSAVMLGALYGLDSTAGLRSASNRYQSKLIAEVMLGQGRYPLYLRRRHYLSKLEHHDVSDDQVVKKRQPLLCRAWTYQEHMISQRVFYFSESELIIQCFTDAACECEAAQNRTTRERDFTIGTPGKTDFFNKAINSNKYRRHASRQKNKDSNSKLDRHYISRVWRETITLQ